MNIFPHVNVISLLWSVRLCEMCQHRNCRML